MEIVKKGYEYIEAGLSIHLLRPLQKAPIAGEWSKVANLTKETFDAQLKSHPNANIGVRLGEPSKIGEYFLYVIDLDISSNEPEDIAEAYEKLESVYKDYDNLPMVKSASKNSRHFYFLSKLVLKSKKLAISKTKVTVKINGEDKEKNSWEIDLMSTGRQVVIPPSVFNGNTYKWDRDLLDYLKDDTKKALMIVDTLKIEEDKPKEEKAEPIKLTLVEIKKSLDKLTEEWLNDYDKWLKIGMALHHEYAGTDEEQEAIQLYDDWSKTGSKYEKGITFKKWMTFKKMEDGITLGTLLYTVLPPKSETRIEKFSKFLNECVELDFEILKQGLSDFAPTDIELDLFIDDIGQKLSKKYNKKFAPPAVRKVIASLKKETRLENWQNAEKLDYGLDTSLATFIVENHFENGNTLINQNNNVFYYKKGCWKPMEMAVLAQITLNGIKNIIKSEDKKYDIVKQTMIKKKKMDDLNALTNQIVAMILKMVTSAIDDDVLNLQHKKEFNYSVINTLNKELYIQDDKLYVEAHRYDSYLLSQINTEYNPDADCPNFKKSLHNVFQDLDDKEEVMRHFMECAGLSIQSLKELPYFMLLLGGGENGKSFIVQQLIKVFGLDSCLTMSITKFTTSAHAEASLIGKSNFIDDDFKKSDILDDGFLKRTSQTTPITANPKFKNEITFMANCTSWILANNNPKTKDVSYGLSRRAQVFPFTHRFTEEEKDLKLGEKIAQERAGILNYLINSYIELKKRGHFKVPYSCLKAKNAWVKSSNALQAFIDEKLIVTEDAKDEVKAQKVFELYKTYVQSENSSYQMTRNNFYDDIASIKGIGTKVNSSDKNMYITGVKLKTSF